MPQIQVLPEAPTFGSQLGESLGGGLSQGISAGLNQMLEQKKMMGLLESLGLAGKGVTNQTKSAEIKNNMPSARSGASNLSPEQVVAASVVNPQLGNTLSNLYQAQQKSYENERTYQSDRSNKYLDKISELATALPERKIALESAKSAIQSGEITPFGGDFVADVLNIPQLRTSSGAQLATSAKTNLIGSLAQITGGRPNQFIEKQINNAFAKAGQTKEANLAQLDIIKAKLDIDEKLSEATDQLADQYRQQLGYVPESIDRDVRKMVKPFADQRMKELGYDLRENLEKEIGINVTKKVPNGTPLTLKTAKAFIQKYGDKAEEMALRLGYEIPSEDIYSRQK